MKLPLPKGDLSNALVKYFSSSGDVHTADLANVEPANQLDFHLSLWMLYELHGGGFTDVPASEEWNPELIALRNGLEAQFERDLRSRFTDPKLPEPFANALFDYIKNFDGVSIAQFVKSKANEDQVRELLMYRSIYHLRESDPMAWATPRLPYGPKAALAELQYDEFGQGKRERLHAQIFARGMSDLGLDDTYGGYITKAPVEIIELNNAMSFFGLHGRLLGASLGHLAAFEATSSGPSRKMAQGLTRLGFPESFVDYYEEHVEADAVHEQLAIRMICEPLAQDDPVMRSNIVFGAFTCMDLENRFASRLLEKWGNDE